MITDNYWIETYTGAKLSLTDPRVEQINLQDIAVALSNICRFTGHLIVKDKKNVEHIWSVAKHSVYVYMLVPDFLKKAALFHDAAEAYISDLNTIIKDLIPEYRFFEDRILAVIATKFDIDPSLFALVKKYDKAALRYEYKYIKKGILDWYKDLPTVDEPLITDLKNLSYLTTNGARTKFLNCALTLGVV